MTFSGDTAEATPLFNSDIAAPNPFTGKPQVFSFDDPEFATFVPSTVPGIGGTLMVNSPAQQEVFFVKDAGEASQSADMLFQVAATDDTTFATTPSGTLYVVDGDSNNVVAITGHFTPGQAFATSHGSYPGLATLDLKWGLLHQFATGLKAPKGLLFAPAASDEQDHNEG